MLKDYQTKIISLFIEQELTLAELYLLFSEQHPEHEELGRRSVMKSLSTRPGSSTLP